METGPYELPLRETTLMLFLWCFLPFRLVHIHISSHNLHPLSLSLSLSHTHTTQSITVPAQGFLNALVYGWTREDFVHTIMHRRDTSGSHFSNEGSAINSGSYRSSILASKALSVNKGYSNSRSYRSLNSTSGKFK